MSDRTRMHVVVGAVVAYALLDLPGGPFLGGALAGYLTGSDLRTGARAGVLAGGVVWAFSLLRSLVGATGELGVGLDHFLWVGLGAPGLQRLVPLLVWPLVGGAVGAYVRRETA